jgi:hypothetical protein
MERRSDGYNKESIRYTITKRIKIMPGRGDLRKIARTSKPGSRCGVGVIGAALILISSTVGILSTGACRPAVAGRCSSLSPETVELIYKLSNQPELMNVEYLRYIIGDPGNERAQRSLKEKNYHWYTGPKRELAYTLHQDGPRHGVITHSSFMINLPASRMTKKEMEKIFGEEHQHVFDQRSFPNDVYSMGPSTYVAFTQPRDSFRVKEIHIGYNGGALPPPGKQDIAYVYGLKQSKALHAHAQGNFHEALPWLAHEARMRPSDPYAHMRLAETFRGLSMVNESIAEYCAAMKLSKGDANVMEPCRLALVEMKVLPESSKNQQGQGKSYLVQNGSSSPPPEPGM